MSRLPLEGRCVLVTRARHQAGKLSEALEAKGAAVIEIPAIEIVPPESFAALDEALRHLSQYQWLIITSANGVQALDARRKLLSVDATAFAQLQIAAVGPATARALQEMSMTVALTPPEYVAESLVAALEGRVRGHRVLLVRAAVARDVIPDALRAAGATVAIAEAYRTVIPEASVTAIRTILAPGRRVPDAATFTSSSTVTNFLALLEAAGVAAPPAMKPVSIGPVTSATLRANGWEPAAEADPHDLGGLVEAVIRAIAT